VHGGQILSPLGLSQVVVQLDKLPPDYMGVAPELPGELLIQRLAQDI
jgi:hypothetical protein